MSHVELALPIVKQVVGRLLGVSDPDHDDAVQVAMIEVMRSLDRYRGTGSLSGWIAAVASHTVYKLLRRRRFETRVFTSDEVLAERASTDAPDEAVMRRRELARVRVHLDALGADKARAIVLHDVAGYEAREIAEMNGITCAAALQRLSRGRRELLARASTDPELA